MAGFGECFADLPDPRSDNARHDLLEVLTIALCALLCGAQSCTDMALFGRAKETVLRQFLQLPHGVPSHDTFSRVFRLLDPGAFHRAFQQFMASFAAATAQLAPGAAVVALDGKTVRRSFDRAAAASPLHLVSAWAADQRLVLAQCGVRPGSNENEAVIELLALLRLEGTIVTADAMHCQTRIAAAIRERGGDYVLALKANQPELLADVRLLLDDPAAPPDDTAESVDGEHGRIETRRARVLSDVAYLAHEHGFPGLAAIARIDACRELAGGRVERSTRYFLLSRPLPAARLLAVVRAHWTIENSLHWVLDVVLDEDRARTRAGNGAENLALMRRLALNLLRSAPEKTSLRAKIKLAGWDDTFLLTLLTQAHMQ